MKNIDPRSWELGRLSAHIELVSGGVRPVALIVANNRFVGEMRIEIDRRKLHSIMRECGTHHTELFIFRDFRMQKIIEFILTLPKQTFVMDWLWGKIFSYSDKEIMDHLKKHGKEETIVRR